MSWLLNLYETYKSNLSRVGEIEKDFFEKEFTLMPISHTTQTAHIEVFVTEDGEFHSAFVVDKDDGITLIPCTEQSSSRSGSLNAPYPLHDKLVYVAGDFIQYAGKEKDKERFELYISNLKDWVESEYSHPKIKSIYSYLQKGQLIRDLVNERILFLDKEGKLISKWDKEYEILYGEKPDIFKIVAGGQDSAFVRFNVYSPDKITVNIWHDKEIYDAFIQYYNELLSDSDYCYVTGEKLPLTERHANKIRHSGDKAKLISDNDKSGFTYRGRFTVGSEAATISYEVSQKAHNALKWLINRQGKMIDQRVFLVWGNTKVDIPSPIEDSFDLYQHFGEKREENALIKSYVHEDTAKEVAKALNGFKAKLDDDAKVNILVLDSATTGRLAVLYYRNIDKDLYFSKLSEWHNRCFWRHTYRKNAENKFVSFEGAPSTKDIAFAAYGPRADDKVVKGLIERMLPCIIDGNKIPFDIVRSAINRAINPVAYEKWEWEKILSITCALINYKEGYEVALDENIKDRSYLFGRLLAIADVLERNALNADEKRATNAIRYMNAFARHPERTWKVIQEALQPYQARLGSRAIYLSKLIDEVAAKIDFDDFNNKPLTGKFLLGFYSQRHELYQKKEDKDNNEGGN